MSKWMLRLAVVSVGLFGLTAASAGEDLDALQKKLVAAWEKQKSMTAKIGLSTHMEMGTMVMDGKGDGLYEFAREGGKVLSRLELKNSMTQKSGESENKMEQSVLSICDGDFSYTLSDGAGGKSAMKSKVDAKLTGEPKAIFTELGESFELKTLPDETLDGLKAYVLEATPKQASPMGPGKILLYFHQDSGFVIKQVVNTADGKPMQTMSYSDMKFDTKIDPERFKFKTPEGVELRDTTADKPASTQPATTQPSKGE